jgi:RNA polymerase sigma factor (sigma-70 family)
MSAVTAVARLADKSTDDLALVAAVRAGDDRAFEVLFERYQARIAAYVRGMLRDHGRAEDVTQEIFISALRRMRETDREIAFRPWIYEIAKNACIDAFRRTRNVREVSFEAGDALGPADQGRMVAPGSAADAVVDAKLAIADLCGAFGGLSETHHEILVMREFDGLSYREIGERLGMSRAAVESTLFRARRRLSEEYEEIASGERCLRVRAVVDARAGREVGLRDRRRVTRHLSHCQPCRRYAHLADVGLGPPPSVARIAALLPLPAFMRRRFGADEAGQLLGSHGSPPVSWSPSVLGNLDPATVSGWSKAVATAATVAVAGLGAGAAVHGPHGLGHLVARAPGIVGLAHRRPTDLRVRALSGVERSADPALAVRHRSDVTARAARLRAAGAGAPTTSAGAGRAPTTATASASTDDVPAAASADGGPSADGSVPPSHAGVPAAGAPPARGQDPVGQLLDTIAGHADSGASSQPSPPPASPLSVVGSIVGAGGGGSGTAGSASQEDEASTTTATSESSGGVTSDSQSSGATTQQATSTSSGDSGVLSALGQALHAATTGSH